MKKSKVDIIFSTLDLAKQKFSFRFVVSTRWELRIILQIDTEIRRQFSKVWCPRCPALISCGENCIHALWHREFSGFHYLQVISIQKVDSQIQNRRHGISQRRFLCIPYIQKQGRIIGTSAALFFNSRRAFA